MNKKELNLALDMSIVVASAAHHKQTRWDGTPYIIHPIRVMLAATSILVKCVAILHDVIEDTKFTLDDLKKAGLPDIIIQAVDAITKRDGEDYYNEYLPRVLANDLAREVKKLDIQDNLSDLDPERNSKMINKYSTALHIISEYELNKSLEQLNAE